MKCAIPLFAIFALALAANESDISAGPHGRHHGTMMTNVNNYNTSALASQPTPTESSTVAGPSPTPPFNLTDKADHDKLLADLSDAKKGFEQKYLDCDVGLKRIVSDVESAISQHDHDKAKRKLDEMKSYKPAQMRMPCDKSETKSTDGKSNENKDKAPKKSHAQA